MFQVIRVSDGAVEPTWGTVISSDHDISGDPVQISLGTLDDPGTWGAPYTKVVNTNGSITVTMKVDTTFAPAEYWVWVKVTDGEMVIIRRADCVVVS